MGAAPREGARDLTSASRDPRAAWAFRAAAVLLALLGLALHAPSLRTGFWADDHVHRVALRGELADGPMRPWSLYDFGARSDWATYDASGAFPWWTSPDWKVRFFRPLTSLSLALDHALYGDWAPGWHLTSLALHALLLVLALALYRALGLPRGTALLALALLALADCSSIPVGWAANRNAVLALLLATAALLALARGPLRPSRVAAALVLAELAALSKESGVAALALVAIFLWRLAGPEPAEQRLARRGAAFAIGLALLHVAGLAAAGFGTRSLFYATPWDAPVRFAQNLGLLASAGLASLIAPLPLDLVSFRPDLRTGMVIASIALVVPALVWAVRALRDDARAPLLAAWLALALLPQAGAPPSERLLYESTVASSGLLALAFAATRRAAAPTLRSRLARAFAWLVLGLATAGSGAALLGANAQMRALARDVRATALSADPGPRSLGHRDAVVLQAPSGVHAFALGSTWGGEAGDRDVAFWPIQFVGRALRLERIDERTLEIESRGSPFLEGLMEQVYLTELPRDPSATWETPLFEVEVARLDADGLRAIRLRFREPLETPGLTFHVAREGRLARIDPPAVGAAIEIERAVPPNPFTP